MKHTIFSEKYRPATIKECILPSRIKKVANEIVKAGDCPNLLLSGPPGCGKTSLARAITTELGCDSIVVNCSEDSGIDTLRVKIREFATTVSLSGSPKVVIMDEFDYANANSFQPALRGAIEEFSKNCRFIFTCNTKNRVIEAIHSRCTCIDFHFTATEKETMTALFFDRVKTILDAEKVGYEEKVLAKLLLRFAPDYRRCLSELQSYAQGGQIDVGILSATGFDIQVKAVLDSMKAKDYAGVRKWTAENCGSDAHGIFRRLFESLDVALVAKDIPNAVVILGEYQYKAGFVADAEINLLACLTEIMHLSFK